MRDLASFARRSTEPTRRATVASTGQRREVTMAAYDPSNILDVAPDDLAHVIKIAQKIARASVEVFGADGVTVQQFNESAGGQVVFHLHVHVIPRKQGVALKPPASEKEKPELLAEQAEKLKAALAA